MPCFTPRALHASPTLRITRWACDGHDAARPVAERAAMPVVMVVLRGCFVLRDRTGRHVAHPGSAIAVDVAHEYDIRHPDGGDVTLAFAGELPRGFIADGPVARPVSTAAYLHLATLARAPRLDAEAADELALEALDALAGPPPLDDRPLGRADREVAAAIEHAIAACAGLGTDLAALAAEAAVSPAHACRAFRRATGTTIHGRVVETRLRHALALVVDTDEPLATIAAATGFANQGHLGNAFRARFGTSPGRARRDPRAIQP